MTTCIFSGGGGGGSGPPASPPRSVSTPYQSFKQFEFTLVTQAPRLECVLENYFLYFSSKTYVVDTQKSRLNETVLLCTQNTCLNEWVRKSLKVRHIAGPGQFTDRLLIISADAKGNDSMIPFKIKETAYFNSGHMLFYSLGSHVMALTQENVHV